MSRLIIKIGIPCENCGKLKVFRSEKLLRNKHFYCSKDCYYAHREYKEPKNSTLKTMKCDFCGKKIKIPKWLREKQEHHYCSKECSDKWQSENLVKERSPFWKGGNDYRIGSKRWQQQRLRVRERDGFRCVDCDKKEVEKRAFDVHHIDPHIKDLNFKKDYNCITLCRKCHAIRHRELKCA